MKIVRFLLFATAVLGLASCSSDLAETVDFGDSTINKIQVTVAPLNPQGDTRTVLTKDNNGNLFFVWSESDEIGIFPDQGYQTGFSMADGAGSATAEFTGGGWGLKTCSTYAAYYPFIHDIDLDKTAIALDYTGQKQMANGSSTHLAAYDFMTAPASAPKNGMVSFNFNHLGTLLHFRFTVPEAGIYTSITLKSDGDFPIKSKLNLVSNTLSAKEYTKELSLSLDQISLSEGDLLDAYMFIPAVDLTGNTLEAIVTNKLDNTFSTLLSSQNFIGGDIWNYTRTLTKDEVNTPYVTFSAEEDQTLTMSKSVYLLEYSLNNGEWNELGTKTISFGGEKGDLRLRGKRKAGTGSIVDQEYSRFIFGKSTLVSCSGDIRTLLDYENYQNANSGEFYRLFMNCTCLVSAPELPAISVGEHCYQEMFKGCTSLMFAPKLPATKLSYNCYEEMFSGCTSLKSAPELPASSLQPFCYKLMFEGCTSLKSAPELPASNIDWEGYQSYYGMFSGCTSLESAPQLKSTTLADYCYGYMFQNCTKLKTAPELPATTLSSGCYIGMFSGCTFLESAPELSATYLPERCYAWIFEDCKNLHYIKMLATIIDEEGCLDNWLKNTASSGIFVKNINASWTGNTPYNWTTIYYDTESNKYYLDKNGTQECDNHGNALQ